MKKYFITSGVFLLLSIITGATVYWLDKAFVNTTEIYPPPEETYALNAVSEPFKRYDVDLVISIDNSGSTCCEPGTDKDDKRLRAAELIVTSLAADIYPRQTSIGLESFGDGVQWLSDLKSIDSDPVRAGLVEKIQSPKYTDYTKISDALERAYQELFETGHHISSNIPAVVILTDGEPIPANYPNDLKGIDEWLVKFNEKNTRLFVILLRDPKVEEKRPQLTEWADHWYQFSQKYSNLKYYETKSADELENIYNDIRNRLDDLGSKGEKIYYDPSTEQSSINMSENLLKAVLIIRKPNPNIDVELFNPNDESIDKTPNQPNGKVEITSFLNSFFKVYTIENPAPGKWKIRTEGNTPVWYILNPESIYGAQLLLPVGEEYLLTNQPSKIYATVVDQSGRKSDQEFSLEGVLSYKAAPSQNLYGIKNITLPPFNYHKDSSIYELTIPEGTIPGPGMYEIYVTGSSKNGTLVNSARYSVSAIKAPGNISIFVSPTVECSDPRPNFSIENPQFVCDEIIPVMVELRSFNENELSNLAASISAKPEIPLTKVSPGIFEGNYQVYQAGTYHLSTKLKGKTASGFPFVRQSSTLVQVILPDWLRDLRRRLFMATVLFAILSLWKPVLVLILSYLLTPLRLTPRGRFSSIPLNKYKGIPKNWFGEYISEASRKSRTLFGAKIGPEEVLYASEIPELQTESSTDQHFITILKRNRFLKWMFEDTTNIHLASVRVVPFIGIAYCEDDRSTVINREPEEYSTGDYMIVIASGEEPDLIDRLLKFFVATEINILTEGIMANPILAIGVGGTGIKILVRAKERLIEAYGSVPDQVSFIGIDTQPFDKVTDTFNGVGLEKRVTGHRPPEYIQIVSDEMQDVEDGFRKRELGLKEWAWLSPQRTRRTMSGPGQSKVMDGAGQVRPIGHMSTYLNYPVIIHGLDRSLGYLKKYKQEIEELKKNTLSAAEFESLSSTQKQGLENELGRFLIFICGSVAGGTGSGTMLDIAQMVQSRAENMQIPIQLMGLIVEADVFTDLLKLESANGVAFLRELNRLSRPLQGEIGEKLPRYLYFPPSQGDHPELKRLNKAPFDNVFLFGAKNRLNQSLVSVPGDTLEYVVAPSAADFIVAHTDEVFAGMIAVPRFNWPTTHYQPGGKSSKHSPFASLGTKTLIFPEQDIRKSAGLKFLNEVFRDYLCPPSKAPTIPPCSKGFIPHSKAELYASDFVVNCLRRKDIAFRRDINQPIMNHPFIENLAKYVFGGTSKIPSNLQEAVRFAGIGHNNPDERVDVIVQNFERTLEADIRLLATLKNGHDDVINATWSGNESWARVRLGKGTFGNESRGEWDCFLDQYTDAYWGEFEQLMTDLALGIMNDTEDGSKQMLIPYRLEYILDVFEAIRDMVERFRTKVEAGFSQARKNKTDAMKIIQECERDIQRNRNKYISAWEKRARAEKDLIGQRLLLRLCDDLAGQGSITREGRGRTSAVDHVALMIREWQQTLSDVHTKIVNEGATHYENRKNKKKIPVREYITDFSLEDRDEKSNGFEKELYQKHKELAIQLLLGSLNGRQFQWQKKNDSNNFTLYMTWVNKGKVNIGADQIAQYLIEWACSSEANRPFCDLASTSEVHMAERMKDFAQTPQNLMMKLTDSNGLAMQTFEQANYQEHAQRFIIFETHERAGASDQERGEIQTFFHDDREGVVELVKRELIGYKDKNLNFKTQAINPRAATAIEVYLGYNLEDTAGYLSSLGQYWEYGKDKALHILKAEDEAIQFELRIENELSYRVAKRHLLHPEVVDLLESQQHIDDFLMLYEFGFIQKKLHVEGNTGYEYYLDQPDSGFLMLTDTAGKEEIDIYGRPISGRNDTDKQQRLERYRFYYALRNFVLWGFDLSRDADHMQVIDYESCKQAYQAAILENGETLGDLTQKREEQFKKWIADPDPLVRDLGILICLRLKTIGRGLGTEVDL